MGNKLIDCARGQGLSYLLGERVLCVHWIPRSIRQLGLHTASGVGPVPPQLRKSRLSCVGVMLVNRSRGQESDAEIAFITNLAAKWAYEENSVEYLLQQPLSSGPMGYSAGAIRSNGRLAQ